ncbi:MAG: dihydrofolate reductase [Anaerolineae bacterium]
MILSLIVAMDANRLIGADGRLPWRLPDDMRWFRRITMGKPVIMGRKTYESLPTQFRPLPGRDNIVVTRNRAYQAEGAAVVHSAADALAAAGDVKEVIVAGGATLYEQMLPQSVRLYLTLIDAAFAGDTYFPEIDWSEWREVSREVHEVDGRHPYRFHWLVLERH